MDYTIYKKQLFEESTDPAGTEPAGTEPEGKPEDKKQPKTYTDEDVDRIINKKFAEWQKKQEKAVSEAAKLAGMNAQEKAEHERDELQKQLDEYKAKDAKAEMAKTVRAYAETENVVIPEDVLETLVTDDADATDANAKAYIKAFKAAVQAGVKEQLTAGRKPSAGGSSELTKDDIAKIADPIARQKAIRENIELYRRK